MRKDRAMSLMYQLLLRRSGLSANAAAKLHQVPVGQIWLWSRLKVPVPDAALHALDLYCRTAESVAANEKGRAYGSPSSGFITPYYPAGENDDQFGKMDPPQADD